MEHQFQNFMDSTEHTIKETIFFPENSNGVNTVILKLEFLKLAFVALDTVPWPILSTFTATYIAKPWRDMSADTT